MLTGSIQFVPATTLGLIKRLISAQSAVLISCLLINIGGTRESFSLHLLLLFFELTPATDFDPFIFTRPPRLTRPMDRISSPAVQRGAGSSAGTVDELLTSNQPHRWGLFAAGFAAPLCQEEESFSASQGGGWMDPFARGAGPGRPGSIRLNLALESAQRRPEALRAKPSKIVTGASGFIYTN